MLAIQALAKSGENLNRLITAPRFSCTKDSSHAWHRPPYLLHWAKQPNPLVGNLVAVVCGEPANVTLSVLQHTEHLVDSVMSDHHVATVVIVQM